MRQMQAFLDDGNQHVSADRNPDLRLHCVLAGAQECLDPQMVLDPFEEQLDLPALVSSQECTSKYYGAMPVTLGAACSSYSTRVPADVAAGPGGESLLWDQTAALYLLHPEIFSPLNQHVVPTIVNGSHEQNAKRLRRLWTEDTNRAVVYK